jgi:hypothetical protein
MTIADRPADTAQANGGRAVNDGYGYGPREATSLDAERAHAALEAIPTGDPRWQAAWDQAFATSRNYFRSIQRGREQRQAVADETQQGALWSSEHPEAGK